MPTEMIKVSLKPVNFFSRNPAIDVPASTCVEILGLTLLYSASTNLRYRQEFNKSTVLAIEHKQPTEEVHVQKSECCSVVEQSKL
jgi:primary-amine oxidase